MKTLRTKFSLLQRLSAYKLFWICSLLLVAVDQISKTWVHYHLDLDGPGITVIDGFFSILYVCNTGAAWSLFEGQSYALALLAFLALGCIFYFRKALALEQTTMQWIFGLICGGVLGNVIDRLLYGHVIDFLDFQLPFYHWPTFNIADCGISIGVVCYWWRSGRSAAP